MGGNHTILKMSYVGTDRQKARELVSGNRPGECNTCTQQEACGVQGCLQLRNVHRFLRSWPGMLTGFSVHL